MIEFLLSVDIGSFVFGALMIETIFSLFAFVDWLIHKAFSCRRTRIKKEDPKND